MLNNEKSPVQTINEQTEIMTFNFSESKNEVRNVLLEGKPFFVAKDVCDVLGLTNVTEALRPLDEDEKLTRKFFVSGRDLTSEKLTSGQRRNIYLISESGLYALILRSNKPYAKTFRKWITSEVIPTILKKGFYSMNSAKNKTHFIDARNIPYARILINEITVRMIVLDGIEWYSVNDYHSTFKSSTPANQTAKKLNALEKLAVKIWVYGNTHPAWFTKIKGLELLASGSRIMKPNQLLLSL